MTCIKNGVLSDDVKNVLPHRILFLFFSLHFILFDPEQEREESRCLLDAGEVHKMNASFVWSMSLISWVAAAALLQMCIEHIIWKIGSRQLPSARNTLTTDWLQAFLRNDFGACMLSGEPASLSMGRGNAQHATRAQPCELPSSATHYYCTLCPPPTDGNRRSTQISSSKRPPLEGAASGTCATISWPSLVFTTLPAATVVRKTPLDFILTFPARTTPI